MKTFLFLGVSMALGACGGPSKSDSAATANPCGDNPCGDNPCGDNPCGVPAGDEGPSIDWADWQSWTKVNAEPFVSKGHKKPWVNVYVPPKFSEAYAALSGEMPEGFAVIKSVHKDEGGAAGGVVNLTVMAKMGSDYDPENGNWYYGVVSADGAKVMKEGKIEMCINCHASGEDYLFGTK